MTHTVYRVYPDISHRAPYNLAHFAYIMVLKCAGITTRGLRRAMKQPTATRRPTQVRSRTLRPPSPVLTSPTKAGASIPKDVICTFMLQKRFILILYC